MSWEEANKHIDYSQAYQVETSSWLFWGILAVGAVIVYVNATNCWFKPVGKMPGWCLGFGGLGGRGGININLGK